MERILMIVALAGVAGVTLLKSVVACASAPAEVGYPPGFASADIAVDGGSIRCVRGGAGPPVILIHGFPEDWAEYRAVMPELAKHFSVISIDLPGVGRSTPMPDGYDAPTIAKRVHVFVQALKLEHLYVVGHDLGGIVTYAYARSFPGEVRGAMILDVPIPGLEGWDEATANFWHIRFIQEPGELAEKMVIGRQDVFLGWSFNVGKFTIDERAHFLQAYGPGQIHAAFEIYRAFPKDAEWNRAQTTSNTVPFVVAVGEKSFFNKYLPNILEGFGRQAISNVHGEHIPDAAHYVVNDNPSAVASLIEKYARQ